MSRIKNKQKTTTGWWTQSRRMSACMLIGMWLGWWLGVGSVAIHYNVGRGILLQAIGFLGAIIAWLTIAYLDQ